MERTYTITLKVQQTFARKIKARDKIDEVQRRVAASLPTGWTVAGASLRSTAKRATHDRDAAKRLARNAARRQQRRDKERRVRIDPDFGDAMLQARAIAIMAAEGLHGWDVDVLRGPYCWHATHPALRDKWEHTVAVSTQVRDPWNTKLDARAGGWSQIPKPMLWLLHQIAHVQRCKRHGEPSHDRAFFTRWARLIAKHFPEDYTEAALAMHALAGLR